MGSKTLWFLNTRLNQAPQFSRLLPGRMPPEVAAQNYRTRPLSGAPTARRPADALIGITAEQAIARGILVAGNPDTGGARARTCRRISGRNIDERRDGMDRPGARGRG